MWSRVTRNTVSFVRFQLQKHRSVDNYYVHVCVHAAVYIFYKRVLKSLSTRVIYNLTPLTLLLGYFLRKIKYKISKKHYKSKPKNIKYRFSLTSNWKKHSNKTVIKFDKIKTFVFTPNFHLNSDSYIMKVKNNKFDRIVHLVFEV